MRAIPLLLASVLLDLLYLVVFLLLIPWLLFLILVKGRGVGSLAERLGSVPMAPPTRPRIWFHAVSVGEFEAALPLIEALEARRPDLEVVISTTTTTAHGVAVKKGGGRPVFLFPLDFGVCVRRTLKRVRPSMLVLVDLELWPNLILNCRARGLPVVVANGRVSASGHARMRKVAWLLRPFVRRIDRYLVQNEEYAERLLSLGVGAESVRVTGNLKFDRPAVPEPAETRARFEKAWGYAAGGNRWIAGCTHSDEEHILLEVHRSLREQHPDLSLIIAPRHVERAAEVAERARDYEFSVAFSTVGEFGAIEADHGAPPDVLVVNEVGRLAELYACADVAFVGGSLIPRGGHNVLEPVAAGTPTTHGPFTANFRDVVNLLAAGGATVEVANGDALLATIDGWLRAPEARLQRGALGVELLAAHRGVAERTIEEMAPLLPPREHRD